MPNDMSLTSTPNRTANPLLARAARFVQRAEALVRQPDLTQHEAACALDHLARMQDALAQEGRAKTRVDPSVVAAEDAIRSARFAVTEALFRAAPGGTTMGLVPHGPARLGDLTVRPASICRAVLDLDALRPFLSEAALEAAIKHHSAATGRADVAGVAYAALPDSALMPCAVL